MSLEIHAYSSLPAFHFGSRHLILSSPSSFLQPASTHLSVALAVVADDLEGGEVAEDLVGRRVGPDPVLVVDDLPVAEPDFLLRLRLLRRLQSNKVGEH